MPGTEAAKRRRPLDGYDGHDDTSAALPAFMIWRDEGTFTGMAMTAKIAIVTGAGTGVGRAVALALAKAGYTVVLAGRRKEPLDRVAAEIKAAGGPETAGRPDRRVAARRRSSRCSPPPNRHIGRLDVLFNNAGIGAPPVPLEDLPFEKWQQVVDTNLTGMFLCTQEAIKIMKARSRRAAASSTTARSRRMRRGRSRSPIPRPSTPSPA